MKFTDQMNREIRLVSTPKRIISLVPSQTELLFDLGLEKEVVGITKFCVHPNNWYRAYHGTSRNVGGIIFNTKFKISDNTNGTTAGYGPGVYCSPNISTAESYASGKAITIQTNNGPKRFKFVFQCCVNPATLNNTRTRDGGDNVWVAPSGADIRPYGILIKEA